MPDAPFAVDAFTAKFEGVHLPVGLTVQSITLSGTGVEITSHPINVSVTSPAKFEANVDEASIVAFLTKKAPGGLKEFEVSLKDGQVQVNAVLKILVELRASAICRLVIKHGKQLMVELDSADVLAVGAKSLIKGQIDQLNPIFDVAELPLPALLETVTIEDGLIRLTGTVLPPGS
ncbi:MAG: LmeA family phospholipid-binding protein [Fimbriimonadaceae bacterium]